MKICRSGLPRAMAVLLAWTVFFAPVCAPRTVSADENELINIDFEGLNIGTRFLAADHVPDIYSSQLTLIRVWNENYWEIARDPLDEDNRVIETGFVKKDAYFTIGSNNKKMLAPGKNYISTDFLFTNTMDINQTKLQLYMYPTSKPEERIAIIDTNRIVLGALTADYTFYNNRWYNLVLELIDVGQAEVKMKLYINGEAQLETVYNPAKAAALATENFYLRVVAEQTVANTSMCIDNLVVYKTAMPPLRLALGESGLDRIAVRADDYLDPGWVTPGQFSVTTEDGEQVGIESVQISPDNPKQLVIIPAEPLAFSSRYTVRIDGVRSKFGREGTASLPYTTRDRRFGVVSVAYRQGDSPLEKLVNGALTAGVRIENECTGDKTVFIVHALMKGLHCENVQSQTAVIPAGQTKSFDAPVAVNAGGAIGEYCLNTFLWDGAQGQNRLFESVSLQAEGYVPPAVPPGVISLLPMDFQVDLLNRRMEVSGKLALTNALITCSLADSGGRMVYAGEIATDGDGKYRRVLSIPDVSGMYTLSIGNLPTPVAPKTKGYFKTEEVAGAFALVNGKSAAEIAQTMSDPALQVLDKLGIDYPIYDELADKSFVYKALARGRDGQPFGDILEFYKALRVASILASLKENRTKVSAADALLELYAQEAEEDQRIDARLYARYRDSFGAQAKGKALDSAFSSLPETAGEAARRFEKGVILAAVKYGDGEIASFLFDYNGQFSMGLNVSGYNALGDNRLLVDRDVIGGDYGSIALLAEYFNGRVGAYSQPAGSQKDKGGGAGASTRAPVTQPIAPLEAGASTQQVSQTGFHDLDAVPWAAEAIGALAEQGIVKGRAENEFSPHDDITREEFVKLLVLAYGLYDPQARCAFTDAGEGAWYCSYIASARAAGIVTGKGDGSFGVGESISREDMAVMAYRALKSGGRSPADGTAAFADSGLISEYAVQAVGAMAGAGIISGTGDGLFSPKDRANRAQAAVLVFHTLQRTWE